jgi:ubiquinone/menaquinone biosynthesis C-methylase UbiE
MDAKTKESKENYNKIAMNYENSPEGKYTLSFNHYLCELVLLKKQDRILDIGCGNGRLLKMITNQSNVEAFGIDISEEMVRTARDENPEITFCVSEADKTPFEDGFFDVVTVCCAFHHFVGPESFLKEAHRILKPQGKLYIADPTAPGVIRIIENFIFPRLKMGDVRIYNRAEMKDFFERANFSGFSCKTDGYKMIVEGYRTKLL